MRTNPKNIIILLSFCLLTSIVFGQPNKELSFIQTTKDIVSMLSTADSVGLLKYIDKETGVYILFRNGMSDEYMKLRAISFTANSFPNIPYYENIKYTTLLYDSLPNYNCDSLKWSKYGTFADTLNTDKTLSQLLRSIETAGQSKVPSETLAKFQDIENSGRRVIISGKDGNDLIIHLIYKNKKWYLTIIDKLTTDCSA